jgi:hypothetical protein
MLKLDRAQATSMLNDMVLPERRLPEFLFRRRFDGYRFFDADVSTNDEFLDEVQDIIRESFGNNADCHVFSASGAEYLSALAMDENWAEKISMLTKTLRADGDCGGLILLADTGAWIAVQRLPVEIGVFAFNIDGGLGQRGADCFFDCGEMSGWLIGSSERDISLRESLGAEYLTSLVKNYCVDEESNPADGN